MRACLRVVFALWCCALAACGNRGEPLPFSAGVKVSVSAAPLARPGVPGLAEPGPRYEAATGVLSLPGLTVVEGATAICFDAVLRTVALSPLRLELASATPRSCGGVDAAGGRYDAASGLLTLPALPVQRSVDAACYDAQLRTTSSNPIQLQLVDAVGAACAGALSGPPSSDEFRGSVVLGAPTGHSVRLSVLAPEQSGTVSVRYGVAPGVYSQRSATVALRAGQPLEIALEGLLENTRYHYQLQFLAAGSGGGAQGPEYSFQTARPSGSRFSFTVQADSHLDENSDLDTYRRTLGNVLADAPDFHIDLGDTFMTEKHTEPLSAVQRSAPDSTTVEARYAYEHGNFGLAGHSVPLFLVNGNHDGELGWLKNGTDRNLAIWATQARLRWFAHPLPDAFYSGDSLFEPFVGERAAWYAWHWGDALFVVLDPFWNSAKLPGNDGWGMTLGQRQYQWLAATLAASPARYKFVFIHNLVGGLDGQMRGGVEAAPFYEWGGQAADGTPAFAQKRPGWPLPIHALLVQHRVTAVFHGHDHLYARQELDGVVYQEVPQPSARNFSSGASLARDYHYAAGTLLSSSGHLRVEVGPDGVTTSYVRAWLPTQENAQRRNGQVDDRWSLPPAGRSSNRAGPAR